MVHQRTYAATISTTRRFLSSPAHDVQHPGQVVYTEGFETEPAYPIYPGGFTPSGTAGTVTLARSATSRTGQWSLSVTATGKGTGIASAFARGLTIGVPTVLSAFVNLGTAAATTTATVRVEGVGVSAAVNDTGWVRVSLMFTPTATSHTISLGINSPDQAGLLGLWDDVTVTTQQYVEHVPDEYTDSSTSYFLAVSQGTVILDETQIPYGQISANLSVTRELDFGQVIAAIDPRVGSRLILTATDRDLTAGTTVSRTFDLQVTGRRVNENDGTVDVTATTDDVTLTDFKWFDSAPDTTFLGMQKSVRAIVQSVMLKAGTGKTLQPSIDADFTTLTAVTNMMPNGGFERGITGWSSSGFSLAAYAPIKFQGLQSLRVTATATGNQNVNTVANSSTLPVSPGQKYTFAFYSRANSTTTTRLVNPVVRFYNSAGAVVVDVSGTQVRNSGTTWTRHTVTVTAPGNAAFAYPYITFAGLTSGEIHYLDAAMLTADNGLETDGINPYAYFDGDTAATATYYYGWAGTIGQSASTRTPVFERPPEVLAWQPGDAAYDFIEPILTQVGLRLFCDEQRRWWLVEADYTPPGLLVITAGKNLFDGTDEVSRELTAPDGSPLFFDAAIVKYSWTDQDGVNQTRYDVFSVVGGSNTVHTIEFDRPYPGPGAAKYIVGKVTGRGRQFEMSAEIDWTGLPGQETNLTFPYIDAQVGFAASITWDLGADTMSVATRGLIETPATAWYFQPAGKTWASVPTGNPWTQGA